MWPRLTGIRVGQNFIFIPKQSYVHVAETCAAAGVPSTNLSACCLHVFLIFFPCMLIQIYLGIKCTCHLESWQERSQCSLLRGHAWTVAPNLLTEEAAAPSSDEVKKAGMLLANYKPPSQARQKMCTKHHSATAALPIWVHRMTMQGAKDALRIQIFL